MRSSRVGILAAGMMLVGSAAWAQNSGSVTLNGSVTSTLSLTYDGSSLVDTAETSAQAQGDALAFVMNMGDVGDLSRPTTVGGTVYVALRANNGNTQFTVSGQVSSSSGLTSGSTADLGLDDIGFGVGTLAATGTGATAGAGTAAAVAAGPIGGAYDPIAGGAPFTQTLADLSALTALVQASGQVSNSGGLSDANNGLRIPLIFAVEPAMYTPVATWSTVVQFTASTP